jgi:predicted transcriptional regulator with HTH domain
MIIIQSRASIAMGVVLKMRKKYNGANNQLNLALLGISVVKNTTLIYYKVKQSKKIFATLGTWTGTNISVKLGYRIYW